MIMVHHDFVSVFYCFYEWFSRAQRVLLLLCALVTLMAADATVFATIMFKVNTCAKPSEVLYNRVCFESLEARSS